MPTCRSPPPVPSSNPVPIFPQLLHARPSPPPHGDDLTSGFALAHDVLFLDRRVVIWLRRRVLRSREILGRFDAFEAIGLLVLKTIEVDAIESPSLSRESANKVSHHNIQ